MVMKTSNTERHLSKFIEVINKDFFFLVFKRFYYFTSHIVSTSLV